MRTSERSSRFIAVMLVAAALHGCANPGPPPTQTIHLQTPGCSVAACDLSNDLGSWHLDRTPGSVTVSVSNKPLSVSCRAGDGVTATALASSSRPPTSGAGAVTGGLASGTAAGVAFGTAALTIIPALGALALLTSAGLGAAVGDVAETQSLPLRYAESISIPMGCLVAEPDSAALKQRGFGFSVRGITANEAAAAGLGERTAVLVTSVTADGVAAVSGLRSGDVVLALNGRELGDAADLEERVRGLPADVPPTLRVWRDGSALDVVLVLLPGAP